MSERLLHGSFVGGKSLLASRTHALLIDESLRVIGTWRAPPVETIVTIALSANGAHAAIAMESGNVVVWSAQTLASRTIVMQTMTPEEKLMAALLGEQIAPPAAQLAVSEDGETVAIVSTPERERFTLALVGRHSATTEIGRVEPWTRMSTHDGHVVLGRQTYAFGDLARSDNTDEVIARSGDATLVRTPAGAVALRTLETLSTLGEWDDAGFASGEVVLVRLPVVNTRNARRFLEVERLTLASSVIETRSIPWDAPDAGDPFGERPALCDCANLRGVVYKPEGHVWVDLRTGEPLGAVA